MRQARDRSQIRLSVHAPSKAQPATEQVILHVWGGYVKKHVFCTVFITFPLPKLDFTCLQSKNTSIHPALTSGTLCIPRPVRTHSTLPLWWLATATWSHLPALKSGYWQRLDECKEHKAFLQLHWAGKGWTTYTRVFKNKADVDVSSISGFINKKFAKKMSYKATCESKYSPHTGAKLPVHNKILNLQ